MKKQSWIKPLSKEDVAEFAKLHMNIKEVKKLEEVEDEEYGKYFQVAGISMAPSLDVKTMTYYETMTQPVSLGEFGIVSPDPYNAGTFDEPRELFGDDAQKVGMIVNWIMMVASKNEGRTIDGKTYPEAVSEVYGKYIELAKRAQMNKIESVANERKSCVDALTREISKNEQSKVNQ